ncbi:MAG: zinc-ribbon domain-containing protein [Gemmataceae bacterium]|nr:zinc-ribbon domain-containing protein [Gemmataceae bacterium]
METDILFCPACQGKVRIPRELLGTAVRCPLCQAEFTAPPPPAEWVATSPAATFRADGDSTEPPPTTGSAGSGGGAILAGIALVVTSLLSVLMCLFRLYAAVNPELLQAVMEDGPFGPPPPGLDFATIFLVWGSIFLVVSLVAALGGFAMILRRGYPLALIGSIASLLNAADCCCLPFNFLAGLMALIILLMPSGRQAFNG